jgi:hypothetical protein
MGSGNLVTGGPSGALNCVANVCDIVTPLVPLKSTANVWLGTNDYSNAAKLLLRTGSGVPSTGCASVHDVGSVIVRNDAQSPGSSFYVCDQTGPGVYSWELPSGSVALAIPLTRSVSNLYPGQRKDLALAVYDSNGALSSAHIVRGQVSQADGTPAQVILTGRAVFASTASYSCTADAPNVAILYSSGTTFSVVNPKGGVTRYVCLGT